MEKRLHKCLSLLLYGAVIVGGMWLGVKFIFPWTAPFILAFIFASALEPLLKKMCAHGLKRTAAAGILSLGGVFIIAAGIFMLTAKCMTEAMELVKKSPRLMLAVGEGIENLESRAFSLSYGLPEPMEEYISQAAEALMDTIYSLPAMISQRLLDFIGKTAQKSPSVVLFTVTAGLGTYFILAAYPETLAAISSQLPKELRKKIKTMGKTLKGSLYGFFRAQFILMAMTFFQLLPAFFILKVEHPVGAAAGVSIIDALPVFGTGIVLIPWAVYSLLMGNYSRAAGFLISWALVNLVRSCAQAKLTGDEIGLKPIASLAAVYIGWKVWGVGGMLVFPLLFAILQQLYEKGLIQFKNSE